LWDFWKDSTILLSKTQAMQETKLKKKQQQNPVTISSNYLELYVYSYLGLAKSSKNEKLLMG